MWIATGEQEDFSAPHSAAEVLSNLSGDPGLRITSTRETSVAGYPAEFLEIDVVGPSSQLPSYDWGFTYNAPDPAAGDRAAVWVIDIGPVPVLVLAITETDGYDELEAGASAVVASFSITPGLAQDC